MLRKFRSDWNAPRITFVGKCDEPSSKLGLTMWLLKVCRPIDPLRKVTYHKLNILSDITDLSSAVLMCWFLGGIPFFWHFLEEWHHAANNFGPILPLSLDTPPSDLHPFWFPLLSFSFCSSIDLISMASPRWKKKSDAILFYPLFWPAPLDCRGLRPLFFLHHGLEGGSRNTNLFCLLSPLFPLANIPHYSKWKKFVRTTTRCRENAVQR